MFVVPLILIKGVVIMVLAAMFVTGFELIVYGWATRSFRVGMQGFVLSVLCLFLMLFLFV